MESVSLDAKQLIALIADMEVVTNNIETIVARALPDIEAVAKEMILEAIMEPGDKWAAFMAPRTRIKVEPAGLGVFKIVVEGIPESQLPNQSIARPSTPGKDNLWAVNEYGAVEPSIDSSGVMTIVKDSDGSQISYRRHVGDRYNYKSAGRVANAVQEVLPSLRADLQSLLSAAAIDFMTAYLNIPSPKSFRTRVDELLAAQGTTLAELEAANNIKVGEGHHRQVLVRTSSGTFDTPIKYGLPTKLT